MVPLRIAEQLRPRARVLGLSGGGRFEEIVRAARTDLEIVSAEKDDRLWPALREHAFQHSYRALCGDFQRAGGLFDLIYLDLTGNSSDVSMRLVRAATKMLTKGGWLVVTITPDHELDSAVSLNRPVTVVSLLAVETRMRAVGAMRYPNGDGKRVTLVVLHGSGIGSCNRWRRMLDIYELDDQMRRRNFWITAQHGTSSYGFLFGDKNTRYRSDPKNAAALRLASSRAIEQRRIRILLDPEYAERQKARMREYRQRPEVKAKARAAHAEWQRTPAGKAWHAAYRARRKAAVQSTAAEALDQAA